MLAMCISVAVANCGGTERTPSTAPSAVSMVPVVFVHYGFNPADNQASRTLVPSENNVNEPGILGFVAHRVFDDFTSEVTAIIRTVSWQGGYCAGAGGFPGAPPISPPAAAARSFQILFYSDVGGRPNWNGAPLYDVTVSATDAHEQFTFDTGPTTAGCNQQPWTASYYDYAAVLPTPFAVTAGTRYWLIVLADTRGTRTTWGWRVGRADNNYSMVNGQGGVLSTQTIDFAFSLSSL